MIADIHLQNFRSYKDQSFEFEPGVNIIVGPNASGKTNLLESILVIARGKSYRVKDKDLISFNSEWSRIDSRLENNLTRTIKINSVNQPHKLYEIENKQFRRLSLERTLPIVLFEPNNLLLLSGKPDNRREYLDDLLEYTTPGFGTIRRQYKRVLMQRNVLLKQNKTNNEQFFPWNIRLSELAGKIVKARLNIIDHLNKNIKESYMEISKTKSIANMLYKSDWIDSYESKMLRELELKFELDKIRGYTSSGPHRDDIVTLLNGYNTTEIASRGEVRTMILSLKVAELKLLENLDENISPILLLDDVFSELDGARRHALTDYLIKYQTFITTTDADLVLQHFSEKTNIIPLSFTE
jgi:DNA replication and repair protein RecF